MGAQWRIEMLGCLRATRGDRVVDAFRTRQAGLLLAYLALNPGRPHARDDLANLLYDQKIEDDVRNRFRINLWFLRQVLEPDDVEQGSVLAANRRTVELNPDAIQSDVAIFEKLIAQAKGLESEQEKTSLLKEAVSLYKGEFLPGYPGDWVLSRRVQLAELYVEALQLLTTLCEKQAQLDEAIQYALLAVQTDPTQESSHCDLMRLYTKAGKPSSAVRQYRSLEKALARHLNVTPSRQARSLANEARYAVRGGKPSQESSTEKSKTAKISTNIIGFPKSTSRFFGREEEISQIQDLLSDNDHRLVALIGPGGCGKTRLAIESSKKVYDQFDSMVFVSLADVSDASLIEDKVLNAMGLERNPRQNPIDQICFFIENRNGRLLLVLDNMEHLLMNSSLPGEDETYSAFEDRSAEWFVHQLLQSTSQCTILATTRQRLGLEGEEEVRVQPLPTIKSDKVSLEILLSTPSGQMFVDRAKSVVPYFKATPRNAKALATLCEKLEGIPLAIELAAPWIQVLSPSQMLEMLGKRFDLLVSRRRDINPRHMTLRAAVDYSYQQLNPDLQRFFTRLSVFQGGWNLDMAEKICGENAIKMLAELRERSLVIAEETGDGDDSEMRYRMLETLREFAQEQLSEEEKNELSSKLANYFAEWFAGSSSDPLGPRQAEWYEQLEREHDNIRTAFRWSFETCNDKHATQQAKVESARTAAQMIIGCVRFWGSKGYLVEGLGWMNTFLSLSPKIIDDVEERTVNRVELGKASFTYQLGHFDEALHQCEIVLEKFIAEEDRIGVAWATYMLGTIQSLIRPWEESKETLLEAIEIFREVTDKHGLAYALNSLGCLYFYQRILPEAEETLTESIKISAEVGDYIHVHSTRGNLSLVLWMKGEREAGYSMMSKTLGMARKDGYMLSVGLCLGNLSEFEIDRMNYKEAVPMLLESIQVTSELGQTELVCDKLALLSMAAWKLGRLELSASLLGLYEALKQEMWKDRDLSELRDSLMKELGEKRYKEMLEYGRDLSVNRALSDAEKQLVA